MGPYEQKAAGGGEGAESAENMVLFFNSFNKIRICEPNYDSNPY
jgi:hypothetical protein